MRPCRSQVVLLLAAHRAAAILLILALALALPGAGRAQEPERPPVHPMRDVDVTYRMERGQRVVTERMRWLAAEQRQRLDPPTEGLFVIIDYRAGRMRTVQVSDRLVLEMAAPPTGGAMGGSPADGRYERQGEDRVAGLPCTEWQTTATDGKPAVACITEDGVLLRATRGGAALLTATSVSYAPQDPALFAVPAGFTVRRPEDAR